MKKKLIRITTVPMSMAGLLKGQLGFMNQIYEVIGISSEGPALKQVEEDEGIRTYTVDMTRKITPFKDLIAVYKLYRFFLKEKPFIVHTHTPKAGTLGMLAAKLAGVPHRLHTIAGMPLLIKTGAKRKLLNLVERSTYSCATKIYPNSKGLQHIILELGFTKDHKLKVLGQGSSNGIDTNFFNPELFSAEDKKELSASLDIKCNDFVFIFVGRLVKDKGINELITAFKKISISHTNVKLLLVGPYENHLDPLLPATDEFIKNSHDVKWVGWQTDVRPYFAIANCLVFPSYREGFPNVVMQAGAMGLFSIVSDINGCNEIIENGINGMLMQPGDPESLFSAMENCLLNPKNKKADKALFRKIIKERYEREYMWQEILKEYKLLENSADV